MGDYDISKINITDANDMASIREKAREKEYKKLRDTNIKFVADEINKAINSTPPKYEIKLYTYPDLHFILPVLENKGYKVEKIQGYCTYKISWLENLPANDISDLEFHIIVDSITAHAKSMEMAKRQRNEEIYNSVCEINDEIKRFKKCHRVSVKIDSQYYEDIRDIFQKKNYKVKSQEFHCPLGLYPPIFEIVISW